MITLFLLDAFLRKSWSPMRYYFDIHLKMLTITDIFVYGLLAKPGHFVGSCPYWVDPFPHSDFYTIWKYVYCLNKVTTYM